MIKQLGLLCAVLLVAYPATAGPLVMWQGSGQVDQSFALFPDFPDDPHHQPAPPVGTPLSLTLTFDPSAAFPTIGNTTTPGCVTVPVSSSFTLGGYTYTTFAAGAAGSTGFTHSQLPGNNCVGSIGGFTQFSLHNIQEPADTPWSMHTGGVLIVSYRDSVAPSSFPSAPTTAGALVFYTPVANFPSWTFIGSMDLRAVDQMDPVPEPGTLTLLGLGLAATLRTVRGRRQS